MGCGILPGNGLGALAWSLPPSPISMGSIWGNDGVSHRYRFDIYRIEACPAGTDAVYVFARLEGSTYAPVYVGRAELLSRRLVGHDRRGEAIRLGARFLLVHIPGHLDPIRYEDAERRLIRCYAPALNEHFNPLAALLAR